MCVVHVKHSIVLICLYRHYWTGIRMHQRKLVPYGKYMLCVCFRAALDRASVLLSMKREIVRLDNVWGVGGGQRPVKHLVKEV